MKLYVIRHVYVSSLERAKQTAALLNATRNLPITYSDDLQEVNFGDLNGKTYLKKYQERHMAMDYDWRPSGENVDDVKARTLRILTQIHKDNEDGEVLIVAHGGTIRMLHYLEHGEPLGVVGNASLFDFDLDKILGR